MHLNKAILLLLFCWHRIQGNSALLGGAVCLEPSSPLSASGSSTVFVANRAVSSGALVLSAGSLTDVTLADAWMARVKDCL